MRSYTIGREAILLNQGVNSMWQTPHAMLVRGYLASISLGFNPTSPPAGFSQAFVNLWVTEPYQSPTFGTDAYVQYAGPPPSAWAGDAVNAATPNPHGLTLFGSDAIVPGGIFSAILKTRVPEAVNEVVSMSGLALYVPVASTFVLHMDAQSQGVSADVEIGLTLCYDLA